MRGFVWMGRFIPMYGVMILIGIFAAAGVAWMLVKHFKYDPNHLLLLIAYGFLGGMVGAKLLFLLISWNQIEWSSILDPEYLKLLMSGGFVFYGGLIGGLLWFSTSQWISMIMILVSAFLMTRSMVKQKEKGQ